MKIKYYVGLDVHARLTAICILDAQGQIVLEKTILGHVSKVFDEGGKLKGSVAVCYEASNGYGYLYDLLSKAGIQVTVAHPGQLRLIFRSKRKCDRIDAQKLAKGLYLGEVPSVYVPGLKVRDWRRVITLRQQVVASLVRCKNRMRSLLRHQGVESPQSLWSKKGLSWLKELPWSSEQTALECSLLLEELTSQRQRLKTVTRPLDRIAQDQPGVQVLRGIPGIGPRTAEAVVAWIDDPRRFGKNNAIGSYFGGVPCQDSSAGKQRYGHITKQGPALIRKLLAEATWQVIYRSPEVHAYWTRIQKGDPDRRKIASVATAHYLARVMLAMLRENTSWKYKAQPEQAAA